MIPLLRTLRSTPPVFLAAVVLWIVSGPIALAGGVFSDDFESGNFGAWSAVVGPLAPDTQRFTDLDLRDPHLFLSLVGIDCNDFTDDPLPLGAGPSFNQTLADSLTLDGDMDGFLDLSPLLLFRPLDPIGQGQQVDVQNGLCTAPLASTVCAPDPLSPPEVTTYDTLAAGTCLEPVVGTTSGYSPAVPTPAGPCFVTEVGTFTFDFNGVPVTLEDAQIAASWTGSPVTATESGLIRGFLSETAATTILLPAELPIVGGQPITVLLPGGSGNCAAGDDRDTHLGEIGWWFYLEFSSNDVDYFGA